MRAACSLTLRGVALLLGTAALAGCPTDDEVGDTDGGSQSIGPAGGEVASADGLFRLIFPAGALASETTIRIQPTLEAPISIGTAYTVSPRPEVTQDITAIYDWSTTNIGDRDPNQIVIARDIGAEWETLRRTEINFDNRTVTCLDDAVSFNYGLITSASIPGDTDTDTDTDTDGDTDPGTGTETDTTTVTSTTDPMTSTTDPSTETGDNTTSTSGSTDTGEPTGTTAATATTGSTETGDPPAACDNMVAEAGEVCLVEGITYNGPLDPRAVAAADLDGDNNIDLVVAGGGADQVTVRRGNGNGIFLAEVAYDVGTNPSAIILSNVDGTAGLDLIAANEDDDSISVLSGNADSTFADQTAFDIDGNGPVRLAIADIDEDMNLDVFTANSNTAFSIMLGDGAGMFTAGTDVIVGGAQADVQFGDFNGDNNLDAVVAVGTTFALAAGNGAGAFGAPTPTAVGTAVTALALDDFNGDNNLDVAAATSGGTVNIFLGNGGGLFGPAVPFTIGMGTVAMQTRDMDGDGELDLVTVDGTDDTVSILLGNGVGSFGDAVTLSVGEDPRDLAIADFNNDTQLDVAVVNFADDNTSILLSSP